MTLLSWRVIVSGEWSEVAKSVLPNLTGFSIAAYALLFSVLDSEQRRALRQPSARIGGRSPLLVLASGITHAIIIQIAALIVAIIFWAKPFPYMRCTRILGDIVNTSFSSIGMFLTFYGIILIVAAALSLFKLMVLVPIPKPQGKVETNTPSDTHSQSENIKDN
jgi:hypothetical protein